MPRGTTSTDPLPYDMGNAGDLLKHGVLAEFTRWWCGRSGHAITFLDPFGGRPWTAPPLERTVERVHALDGFAIHTAQPDLPGRYFGSGHLVLNAARAAGSEAEVLVSDRDERAFRELLASGLKPLRAPGFDPNDAYTVLSAAVPADLLLVDPLAEFLLRDAPRIVPKIAEASRKTALVLFALDMDPRNRIGRRYRSLKEEYLGGSWVARCAKLRGTGVKGESRYESEVLLAVPREIEKDVEHALAPRLSSYCERLSAVLGTSVTFDRVT